MGVTRIDGIDMTTALAVISETGTDMKRFKTAGHFASWLGLGPGTKITGGKVMSSKTKRLANRAAQTLRLAAAACAPANRLWALINGGCARECGIQRALDVPRPSTCSVGICSAEKWCEC